MSGPDALIHDEDIDLGGIFSALLRRWWLITVITAVSGVSLFLFLSSLDDKYLSTARILIKDGNTAFTRTTSETGNSTLNSLDQQAIGSEVEIVHSDLLALDVIDELNLTSVSEFNKSGGSSGGLLGKLLPGNKSSSVDLRNKALDVINERLQVYSIDQSRVIVVEFWAHDPNLAQRVTGAIAQKYVDFKARERTDSQNSATVWLDPRIRELEEAVNQKEAAVAEYRASEDLLRVDDKNALLATQQLSQVSTELSRLKAERSKTQARVDSIKQALGQGASLDVIPEVQQSALIQRLREREVGLESQVSDLSVTLLPGHPRLQSLNSQLSKLRAQIRNAAQDVVKSLERDVAATRDAEADLAKEITRLKSEAARVDSRLVELRAREREAEAARQLLAEYKSRSLEAKSREGLSLASAEIISPATFPRKPYFPKVVPFTLAGTAAVFVLTSLLIIAGSMLTSISRTSEAVRDELPPIEPDVGDKAGLGATMFEAMKSMYPGLKGESGSPTEIRPEIGVQSEPPVPEPAAVAVPSPAPTLAEGSPAEPLTPGPAGKDAAKPGFDVPVSTVRDAASAIANLGEARIAVISPGGQKGSKTACLLARHLAAQGAEVVVVDFASGATTTAEMLGRKDLPGFFNLVTGSVEAHNALVKDRRSSAYVMPSGTLFPSQPMPTAELVSEMVDAIAEEFDYCILDCGNAELEDINVVADDNTIAVISVPGATKSSCDKLSDTLKWDGFEEIIRVAPVQNDHAQAGLTPA